MHTHPQALRRRQFRHAAKHSSKALAWGHWLVATAADVAVAGASSLTHTTHFVINEYLQSSSSHRKDLHSNKHSSTSSSNGSKSSTHKSSSHSVLTVNGTRKCSVVLAAAPAAAHDSSSDTSSCCSSQSSMDDCPDTIKGAATQPAKCVACHAPSRPSSCTACNSSSTYNTICIGSSTSDMLSISTAYDESCCPTAYITTYSLPMSRSSSSSSDLSSRSSDISTAAALGKHTAASGKNSYFNNNSDHSSSGKHVSAVVCCCMAAAHSVFSHCAHAAACGSRCWSTAPGAASTLCQCMMMVFALNLETPALRSATFLTGLCCSAVACFLPICLLHYCLQCCLLVQQLGH